MSNEWKSLAPLIIIWEFRAREDKIREFELAHGANGNWAQLFRRSPRYIRTELHRNSSLPGWYFTLDFWEFQSAFDDFKQQNALRYKRLDEECASLTVEENFLGHCESPEQARSLLATHGLQLPETAAFVRVRSGCLEDIPAIASLAKSAPSAAQWTNERYEEMFEAAGPLRLVFVAEDNTTALCAFAVARIAGKECELENIVVRKDRQLCGIGRKLVGAIIEAARAEGAASIFLEVRESNWAARALYEHCRFAVAGRRAGYYDNPPEDATVYQFNCIG